MVPTAAHWAQNVAHIVNYFIEAGRIEERAELVALVKEGKIDGRAIDLIKNALGRHLHVSNNQSLITGLP